MTIKDRLQRFIFERSPVRGELIHLSDAFQTIVTQHRYPPAIQRLLGEALCVAGLLSAVIKFSGRLTVQFRGQGKLKMLLAQCDNRFHMRGLAKWDGELSYDELMQSFHQGVLVITIDTGGKKGHYQGIVAWRGDSLAESIEGYFKESEQLATKIRLAVGESSAAGFMLQIIPAADRQMAGLEKAAVDPHWTRLTSLADRRSVDDMLIFADETLLQNWYPEEDIRIFPPEPVLFQCTCTRQHGRNAIYLLGRKDAEEELRDKQVIVVTCDFCSREFVYDAVDVAEIFEGGGSQPPPDTHLH